MNIRLPAPVAVALGFLLFVTLVASFAYGVMAQRYRWFPSQYFSEIEAALAESVEAGTGKLAWYYRPTSRQNKIWKSQDFADQRLNLMTSMGANDRILVTVFDADGNTLNELDVDWFSIWPNPSHLPEDAVPKSRPGNHIHGIVMLSDGDVVFNFEQLGLVRLTPCGDVVWKLPYRTHHSVHLDESGDLWVSGQITRESRQPDYPNHRPPFREPTVLRVSQQGEVLQEISVFELLVSNDLRGYLHLVTADNLSTVVSGDTLHLNDVEVFPAAYASDLFSAGDVMISLRNVSTVLVFDPQTLQIKWRKTGEFVRQHDPDFVSGNTISVFDNNNVGPRNAGQQSRILLFDASANDSPQVFFEGTIEKPFYTDIMGKTQWLEDGSVLITDSRSGRAVQLDAQGQPVWEFVNIVEPGVAGLVEEVQRLPAEYAALFDDPQAERCAASTSDDFQPRAQ